jgi:hypothetical protein
MTRWYAAVNISAVSPTLRSKMENVKFLLKMRWQLARH